MGKLRRAFVDVEGRQLHYRDGGAGDPPLLVLAQCPASSAEWMVALPLLAARRRVIAFDLPGLGDSEELPEPPLMSDYARVTAAFLAALGLGPVDVLGHHSGAAIAVALAAAFPAAVRRLVLVGVPIYRSWEQRYRILARAVPNDFDATGEAVGHGWARTAASLREAGVPDDRVPEYTRLVWIARLQAGTYWYRPYVAIAVWNDALAALDHVEQPAMIVAVAGDGLAQEADWQAQRLRGGRLARLERGGSFPHLGNPVGLTQIVDAFLAD
ncbi:MAG: alpha/beta hydrolase [Chloroflexota bacterium]|nr:alpha/beta hydrolase [Dehalococcoidia bacterium]MDW8254767.1 alpha/beta hydrolase [Chloroflexota bacterium]